jgi:hypothetical protein
MRRQPRISREVHQSVHVEQIVPHPGIDRAVCLQCRNIIFKVISEKPAYVELPRPNHLPSELHVHTPEYTNALKQWFPAVATAAQKNSYRDKKEKSVQAC